MTLHTINSFQCVAKNSCYEIELSDSFLRRQMNPNFGRKNILFQLTPGNVPLFLPVGISQKSLRLGQGFYNRVWSAMQPCQVT